MHFQFFPSCCPEPGDHKPEAKRRLSILSQLLCFPLWQGLHEFEFAFNSFPVAVP
ncbi:MAG: hypothetical protein N3E41_08795 [Thermofilaceae archaeon]|nr:hypothetical protein [Thermofilaceae archaeon]